MNYSDKKEFELHVKHNMKRAYFVALGFVRSHDYAVELSQEAFVKAYNNFYRFDRKRKFFTWYYKILKNLCLNFIRDSKNNSGNEYNLLEGIESEKNPVFELEHKELSSIIESALFKLKENERELIILREFQSVSYLEIAELLEIPKGTVMSKLYYARKKLAKLLKDELDE